MRYVNDHCWRRIVRLHACQGSNRSGTKFKFPWLHNRQMGRSHSSNFEVHPCWRTLFTWLIWASWQDVLTFVRVSSEPNSTWWYVAVELKRKESLHVTVSTWNPKQPIINGCFNWIIPNLYIGNGSPFQFPVQKGWTLVCIKLESRPFINTAKSTCKSHVVVERCLKLFHSLRSAMIALVKKPIPSRCTAHWFILLSAWGRGFA